MPFPFEGYTPVRVGRGMGAPTTTSCIKRKRLVLSDGGGGMSGGTSGVQIVNPVWEYAHSGTIDGKIPPSGYDPTRVLYLVSGSPAFISG